MTTGSASHRRSCPSGRAARGASTRSCQSSTCAGSRQETVKRRGLTIAPEIAVGDGALGFWKALEEIYPGTRHQRCWVHKTTNVLNKVPRAVQATMKADLREIHGAETRSAAEAAIDIFAEKYAAKYARAVECLRKDREALLTFYDFPAEH